MRKRALTQLPVVVALCSALVLCACGQRYVDAKFQMQGSATELYDLSYDDVRILVTEADVAVLFVRIRPINIVDLDAGFIPEGGTVEDYPVKITYDLKGEPTPIKKSIDLAEGTTMNMPRSVVSRDVHNDPRKFYPNISWGQLLFRADLKPDSRVSGTFNMTFESGTETASGRTMYGSFNAKVVQ